MRQHRILGYILLGLVGLLLACGFGVGAEPPSQATQPPTTAPTPTSPVAEPAASQEAGQAAAGQTNTIETEANRDGVVTVRGGQRQPLPAPEQTELGVGDGVDVDENGRAILRFADLLTVELLRDGELQLQQLAADQQSALITIQQLNGVLINDFNPEKEIDRRLTVQGEFAVVTATGTRFMVVREANSPLEWVVGLEAAEGDLEVTAEGTAKPVASGMARWIAPIGEPSAGIPADMGSVEAWTNGLRSGATQREIGEVVWSPADVLADTAALAELPEPGQPFSLENKESGAVALLLDPAGLYGSPSYSLEDCNGDNIQDLVMQAGKLRFDFRPVLARVRALDVTVINRDQPGSGSVGVLDPAGQEIASQPVEAGPGQGQVISMRSDQPYHYAELAMTNGCFLGFSLTPPTAAGEPGEPRPAVANWQGGGEGQGSVEPTERPAENGQMVALPVGRTGYDVGIDIDGSPEDWSALIEQSGVNWTGFETVVYDQACQVRYPASRSRGKDLAGRVHFAYDEGFLYVAFLVEDDGYVYYSGTDQRYFLGDAPQLLLDLDLPGDFSVSKVNEDDLQIDFRPGLRVPGFNPQAVLWQLQSVEARPFSEARIAATAGQGGYFLEAALPWKYLGQTPQPGARLGLAASISDNDTPGTNVQECMVSTAPKRNWQDPTTWGTLLLQAQ